MATISAADVKRLREMTNVGMMDCKRALQETAGNFDAAIELLRKQGIADASKRTDRVATEGAVDSYIHMGGKIGVLVEVNCETDFVARTDDFKSFTRDVALHIAAINPSYLGPDEVPADEVAKEREILVEQAKLSGKPENVIQKIVDGRIQKFFAQICLLEQPFVKDDKLTVGEAMKELSGRIGEKISIRRFARFELGAGIEKPSEAE